MAGLNDREDLPKLTTHDLRHTAISRWIASGLDVVEVSRQAGDSMEMVSTVYAHAFDRSSVGTRFERSWPLVRLSA